MSFILCFHLGGRCQISNPRNTTQTIFFLSFKHYLILTDLPIPYILFFLAIFSLLILHFS